MTARFISTTPDGTQVYGGWRRAYRATEPTPMTISPCNWLYAADRRAFLVAIIESLEEELAQIPVHRFSVERRAARQRALDEYRLALQRIDAAAASKPADPSTPGMKSAGKVMGTPARPL